MRTTTRVTCLEITVEGGGGGGKSEKGKKKRKIKGLDGTRFVQGREGNECVQAEQ